MVPLTHQVNAGDDNEDRKRLKEKLKVRDVSRSAKSSGKIIIKGRKPLQNLFGKGSDWLRVETLVSIDSETSFL